MGTCRLCVMPNPGLRGWGTVTFGMRSASRSSLSNFHLPVRGRINDFYEERFHVFQFSFIRERGVREDK
jgi:hypothetical protein